MAISLRLGLLGQILVALVVVGLVPLAVISIGLVGMNRDAMTEQVLRTHTVATRGASARVASYLDARSGAIDGAVRILAHDPTGAASREALGALLETNLGIVAVVVRDGQGLEVIRAQRKSLVATIDALLFESVTEGEWTVLTPKLPPRLTPSGEVAEAEVEVEDEAWLRLDRPLGANGTLQVVADLKPLAGQINPRELGAQAALTVADLEGRALIGGDDTSRFAPEMMALAATGRTFGAGRYGEGKDASIGAYAQVPGQRWVVLSRQPASVAEATARRLENRSRVAVLSAICLLLVAAIVSHRTLVRPIRELLRDQRSLVGLRDSVPRGRSELDQLRDSFRVLAERVHSREELGEVFLGRYQVLDLIGEGAMGSVFRGWDPALQRPVALKTVRFDRLVGEEGGEVDREERNQLASQLLSEAANVAQFNHPNIVAVHDVQEASDVAFLALEFVEGTSLENFFESRALAAAEVVQVGLGIARGLAAAHEHGIVHHDIKPANVLLGYDGSIKIVDFGVSQTISSAQTECGFVVGTPGYIAPEAIQGQSYGPAADLFALGAALYQAITGHRPFGGTTVQEILVDTVSRAPSPPSVQLPGVPSRLDALIMGLLRKDPARRVSSAEAVLVELELLEIELGEVPLLESREELRSWESQPTALLSTLFLT